MIAKIFAKKDLKIVTFKNKKMVIDKKKKENKIKKKENKKYWDRKIQKMKNWKRKIKLILLRINSVSKNHNFLVFKDVSLTEISIF